MAQLNMLTAKQLVQAYWALMNTNDFARAASLLAPDIVIDWPQTNERIHGRDNFIAIHSHYPAAGLWHFTTQSLIAEGMRVVTVTDVNDGVRKDRAITIFTVDGANQQIIAQEEYWPDTHSAPTWRKSWVAKIDQISNVSI